jgi:hypothetical protein
MKDMIQVTRQLLKRHCFNPNGFEKTECEGKKLKNIAPNGWQYGKWLITGYEPITLHYR